MSSVKESTEQEIRDAKQRLENWEEALNRLALIPPEILGLQGNLMVGWGKKGVQNLSLSFNGSEDVARILTKAGVSGLTTKVRSYDGTFFYGDGTLETVDGYPPIKVTVNSAEQPATCRLVSEEYTATRYKMECDEPTKETNIRVTAEGGETSVD